MNKDLGRLLRFGITGTLNTALDWLVFFLLATMAGMLPAWAQAIAYLTGVVNSWFLNSIWVFGNEARRDDAGKKPGPILWRFLLVTGLSTILSSATMHQLASATSLPLIADKALVTALGMGINFMLYRNWVFAPPAYRQSAGKP